jgi:hypothetical protein
MFASPSMASLANGAAGRLLDIKRRIALPPPVEFEFPVHSAQGRTHEPVVDPVRDQRLLRFELLPSLVKGGKIRRLASNGLL